MLKGYEDGSQIGSFLKWMVDPFRKQQINFNSDTPIELCQQLTNCLVLMIALAPKKWQTYDEELTADQAKIACKNAESVYLHQCTLLDGVVDEIAKLRQLRELSLINCNLEDSELKVIGDNLRQLVILNLENSQITAKGIQHLRSLLKLQRLAIGYNHIGDQGASYISSLPSLIILLICWCDLSFQGAICLSKLSKLQQLFVYGNSVGDVGLNRMRGLRRMVYVDAANTGTIQRSRRVVERVTGLVKFAKDD